MNRKGILLILGFYIFPLFLFSGNVSAQNSFLNDGITQYKQGNYEEAIELLQKAGEAEPASSATAFLLGLAYKQTLAYEKALPHFLDAVNLKPRIKDAVVELAYAYLQLGKTAEAAEWIGLAEKEDIFPARTAFLKGLVLQKEEKNKEAVQAFEKAMALDASLTQSCQYNIALCYVKERELAKADERLRAVILHDPGSDLSAFARQYQEMIKQRMDMEKPLHLSFAMFGQYDSNVVLKPTDSSAATGITGKESPALASSIRIDYAPFFENSWLFNARYSFYNRLHKKHSTSHDVLSSSLYAVPGYSFGNWSLNLAARLNHVLLRDPGYRHYLTEWNIGPMARILLGQEHILEICGGYANKEYANAALSAEEERDAELFDSYLSWIWLLRRDTFVNLRYGFSYENTQGDNWENRGHRISAATTIPVWEKVKMQMNGEAFFQDFENIHTSFGEKREDRIYQIGGGITWECMDNTQFILQYNHTRADSSIAVYDYERNLYSIGFEYRY
ncbi:MAG: tetratricopeptide repeat protein [Desulfococcaceae bacterium]|nr:tetratricopeptide repeat protein [Desulfococcaceae bacterium]